MVKVAMLAILLLLVTNAKPHTAGITHLTTTSRFAPGWQTRGDRRALTSAASEFMIRMSS